MPIRRRANRKEEALSFVISTSSSFTCPPVGSTKRLIHRIMVDFPAPEGPINAITCPFGTLSEIAFNALSPVRYVF